MDLQIKAEAQAALQDSQGNNQNGKATEVPTADTDSVSIASSDNRKVSREDIELVQNLIERCLQLYMNKGEVVRTLSNRARIEPGFTTLVWQKLEEENAEFFRSYYIRLKLKKQIILFNNLLEHQYHLMKYSVPPRVPLAPIQNGIHPIPVNNLPMGYPVMPQHPMPASDVDPMGMSNSHVVNGIPAHTQGIFHPMHMNAGNDIVMGNDTSEAAHAEHMPFSDGMSSVSEMAVSPTSVASNNYFPFPPDISLDSNFTSDVVGPGELQLGQNGDIGSSRDTIRSLGQLWNLSLTDLSVDLTNLEDLGALGEYTGSPFLPSDSDILLDSPENDEMVEEYFADIANGPISDEDKT